MFERFTKPARRLVERSVPLAGKEGAEQVRPEHLLASLLEDERCLAVGVLDGLGAPRERLAAELEQRRKRYVDGLDADDAEALAVIGIDLDEVVRRIDDDLGGRSPSRRRPKFSRAAKKALELSLREALALRHNYIGTEHILLGLVRSGDRVVVDSLAVFDIEPAALRRAVADAVRQAG